MVAALASGESEISGVLFADDTEAMMAALGMLGASMDVRPQSETVLVRGRGRSHLESDGSSAPVRIDARQSGTTSRFILAALALTPGEWLLDGDDQLKARPFADQIAALHGLGAPHRGSRRARSPPAAGDRKAARGWTSLPLRRHIQSVSLGTLAEWPTHSRRTHGRGHNRPGKPLPMSI